MVIICPELLSVFLAIWVMVISSTGFAAKPPVHSSMQPTEATPTKSVSDLPATTASSEVSAAEQIKIQAAINTAIPGLKVSKITPAPVAGFYQVIAGGDVFYIAQDAQHIFYGSLLDLTIDQKQWNTTDRLRNGIRKDMIAAIDQNDMIIFAPKDKSAIKSTVVVFTDVDCVFCRKFHHNINEILALGIEVRYLSFPRQAADSESYKKTISVWCADDKPAMLTLAKSGAKVPDKQCAGDKVAVQAKLGEQLSIRGTPTIVFADGYMLASYLEPKELLQQALEHS